MLRGERGTPMKKLLALTLSGRRREPTTRFCMCKRMALIQSTTAETIHHLSPLSLMRTATEPHLPGASAAAG
jgi:hypothetical protein